jgi:hypothetical protein
VGFDCDDGHNDNSYCYFDVQIDQETDGELLVKFVAEHGTKSHEDPITDIDGWNDGFVFVYTLEILDVHC